MASILCKAKQGQRCYLLSGRQEGLVGPSKNRTPFPGRMPSESVRLYGTGYNYRNESEPNGSSIMKGYPLRHGREELCVFTLQGL